MTMNPLPPQAYTKDTMLKAYAWLMNQSSSIREMATTPDILVSLYLKATRDGDSALERPSIQNFKNELKSLAGMMGELDKPVAQSSAPMVPPVKNQSPSLAHVTNATPQVTAPPVAAPPMPTSLVESEIDSKDFIEAPAQPLTPTNLSLDSASLQMLKEVREQFNLSSESEALRMLIKVGYTKIQCFIK